MIAIAEKRCSRTPLGPAIWAGLTIGLTGGSTAAPIAESTVTLRFDARDTGGPRLPMRKLGTDLSVLFSSYYGTRGDGSLYDFLGKLVEEGNASSVEDAHDFIEGVFFDDNPDQAPQSVLENLRIQQVQQLRYPLGAQAEVFHWFEALGDYQVGPCDDSDVDARGYPGQEYSRPCSHQGGFYDWNRRDLYPTGNELHGQQHFGPVELVRLALELGLLNRNSLRVNYVLNYGEGIMIECDGSRTDYITTHNPSLPLRDHGYGPSLGALRSLAPWGYDVPDELIDDFYPCHRWDEDSESIVRCDDPLMRASALIEFFNAPATDDWNQDGILQGLARDDLYANAGLPWGADAPKIYAFEMGNEVVTKRSQTSDSDEECERTKGLPNNGHTCGREYAEWVVAMREFIDTADPNNAHRYKLATQVILPRNNGFIQMQIRSDAIPGVTCDGDTLLNGRRATWNEVLYTFENDTGKRFADAIDGVVLHAYGPRTLTETGANYDPSTEIGSADEILFREQAMGVAQQQFELVRAGVDADGRSGDEEQEGLQEEWERIVGTDPPFPPMALTEFSLSPGMHSRLSGSAIASFMIALAEDHVGRQQVGLANRFTNYAFWRNNVWLGEPRPYLDRIYGAFAWDSTDPVRCFGPTIEVDCVAYDPVTSLPLIAHHRTGPVAERWFGEMMTNLRTSEESGAIHVQPNPSNLLRIESFDSGTLGYLPTVEIEALGCVGVRYEKQSVRLVELYMVNRLPDQTLSVRVEDVSGLGVEHWSRVQILHGGEGTDAYKEPVKHTRLTPPPGLNDGFDLPANSVAYAILADLALAAEQLDALLSLK